MLKERTLVLNKYWAPLCTISVKSALVLLFRDRARVIDPTSFVVYDIDEWIEHSRDNPGRDPIKSPNVSVAKPEIIILSNYGGNPKRKMAFTRRNLYKRDGFTCQYCLKKTSNGKLTIDHIVPKSKNGPSSWENCVVACSPCNTRKAAKTLKESGFVLCRKPKRPEWSPLGDYHGEVPSSWLKFVNVKN